ncbi:hypothetical protein M885DRAFT_574775 [Pelagophyceae sp. CCMP2097]|nr:hypothetical protein M885DRAFT_574775 [Pelagophyceae sp. CCMP2097]
MLLALLGALALPCASLAPRTYDAARERFAEQRDLLDCEPCAEPFRGHVLYTARFGDVLRAGAEPMQTRLVAEFLQDAGASRSLCAAAVSALASPALAETRRAIKVEALRRRRSGDEDVVGSDARLKGEFAARFRELYFALAEALSAQHSLLKVLCVDFVGIAASLALCRAASAASDAAQARRLDGLVTRHFHALPCEADSVVFRLVEGDELLKQPSFTEKDILNRIRIPPHSTLVVAFAGLGVSGLARFEWRRVLTNVLRRDVERGAAFDVLFVADPASSWYTGGAANRWRGDSALKKALRALRRRYECVVFVGDSMGASAALRFADCGRPDVVLALAPQTASFEDDKHVGRDDLRLSKKRCYQRLEAPLFASVRKTLARRGRVDVHHARGDEGDAAHAAALSSGLGPYAARLGVVAHDGASHDVAFHLKQTGQLEPLVETALRDARSAAVARLRKRRVASVRRV